MKPLHRKFLLITIVSLLGCVFAHWYMAYQVWEKRQNSNQSVFFGYFFWLGIFAIVTPLFFSDGEKRQLFDDRHRWGSFALCLLNVFGPMAAAAIGANLAPQL